MNLLQIRNELGISAVDMGGLMGISDLSNYQRLEKGRRAMTKQQERAVQTIRFVHSKGLLVNLLTHSGGTP